MRQQSEAGKREVKVLPNTLCKSPALCILIMRSEVVPLVTIFGIRTLKWIRSVLMRRCIVPLTGISEVRDSQSSLFQSDNIV